MEFKIYTGTNTIFTSGKFSGACKINGSEGNNQTKFDLIIGLLDAVGTENAYADATSKVANLASRLFNSTSTVRYSLNSEFVSDYSGVNKYVVCNRFDRSVSLDKSNHYITFSGFASTINSSGASNQSTNCVVEWSYNVCYKNKILENGPHTIKHTINYIANMK